MMVNVTGELIVVVHSGIDRTQDGSKRPAHSHVYIMSSVWQSAGAERPVVPCGRRHVVRSRPGYIPCPVYKHALV